VRRLDSNATVLSLMQRDQTWERPLFQRINNHPALLLVAYTKAAGMEDTSTICGCARLALLPSVYFKRLLTPGDPCVRSRSFPSKDSGPRAVPAETSPLGTPVPG
jgi:hypothetical protein